MLRLSTVDETALDDLKSRAVLHLRGGATSEGDERAAHLRTVAEVLVDARAAIPSDPTDLTSRPDWKGASRAYKRWVSSVYDAAGIPSGDRERLMTAVRYHVSTAMHDRLGREGAVEHAELEPTTLRERRAIRQRGIKSLAKLILEVQQLDRSKGTEELTAARNAIIHLYGLLTRDEQREVLLRLIGSPGFLPSAPYL